MGNEQISYYEGYVGDITVIFDHNNINEEPITNYMNNIQKYLEFKLTEEEKTTNYLDLCIHRNNNVLHQNTHRKPT